MASITAMTRIASTPNLSNFQSVSASASSSGSIRLAAGSRKYNTFSASVTPPQLLRSVSFTASGSGNFGRGFRSSFFTTEYDVGKNNARGRGRAEAAAAAKVLCMAKKSVGDLKERDLKGKKVFVRVDLNVPLDDTQNITDDTRIRAALPTIKYLIANGAKVILCSHLGRPKGVTPKYSLKPLVPRLSELLGVNVVKAEDCIGEEVENLAASLPEGGVLLLENVRFHKEEEKNDPEFAKKLAAVADLYVNDAFGTAHRAHASTEGVTKYLKPSVAGFLLQKELDYLVGAVSNPKRPFAAIVGGSKVSSKIGVIESLLNKVDILFLGGGMIFTFYKAQGLKVGSSLVEEDKLELATSLMQKAKQTQRQMGMRMQRRVSILLVVTFSSFLLYATNNNYLLSTQPHIESQSEYALHVLKSSAPSPRGVKVFMDDLPRKFTYGVIRHYLRARGAPLNNDDSDLLYPGNQHSAEWFLFSDLLRPSNERSDSNSSVTVTLDPYDADLFYVPFFSSLSLVANPARQVASDNSYSYRDEDMQEQLVAWLESQLFWGRHQGRDHVIVCQDPNALYKVIHRLKNAVLLVSDFGRLKTEQASLVKDVILPYSHRINSYNGDIGIERRDSLLFFMGNRFRKEGGKVRDMLFQILEDEDDMIIKHGTQSRESRRLATQGMHTSKFCLHPTRDTPSACRLFDAIVSLCVPVIVSDDIELPFEDVIDYSKIAIFVPSSDAVQPGYLASMLRSVNSEKLLQYQRELKKVKKYFEYDKLDGAVDEIWRQVASKVPFIKMMIHREKRITKREEAKLDCSCLCSHRNYSSQTGLL